MAKDDLYSYEQLGPNQLRLIQFLESENEGQEISAVIETFSLARPLPAFHCLSYTWASETSELGNSWVIHVASCKLVALDTLRPFLRAASAKGMLCGGHWWWIDSLCINQADVRERAEQVCHMRHMYVRAAQTIVWLGDQSHDSDLAMEFIAVLDHTIQQGYSLEQIRARLQVDEYRAHWTAFTSLLARRWWTRVWTIQEFVLPPALTFWCGLGEASRAAVGNSLSAADQCTSIGIKETLAFRYGLNRKRVWNLFDESTRREAAGGAALTRPLLSLAAYFCCMDATDDRDRLYGLCALASDGELLDVDYTLSVQDVYMCFARTFIERHKSLDIICFATVHGNPSLEVSAGQQAPSWLPQWYKKSAFLSVPVMVSQSCSAHIGNMRPARFLEYDASVRYSASGDRPAVCEFRGSTLVVQGAVVDEVDGLAGSKSFGMVQSSSACNSSHRRDPDSMSPEALASSICRSLALDRLDRFLRYRMPEDVFVSDFLSLCLSIIATVTAASHAQAKDTIHGEWQDWYNRTRSLHIHGQRVDSILRDTLKLAKHQDLMTQPAPKQDEDDDKTFFGRWYDTVVRMSLRLMVTCQGHVDMVPEKARKGDLVCVLYGCSVPVLLRRKSGANEFTFVGECFLSGWMNGEVLGQPGILEKKFLID